MGDFHPYPHLYETPSERTLQDKTKKKDFFNFTKIKKSPFFTLKVNKMKSSGRGHKKG
jgi:hypothetical protein